MADDDGSYYDVYLSSGFEIDFDKSGNWLTIENSSKNALPDSLFGTEIPTAIKTDANTQYPDIAIIDAEKKNYEFKIKLATGIDLMYDASGKFMRRD